MKNAVALLAAFLFVAPISAAGEALSPALVERLRNEAPPERPGTKPTRLWKTSIAVLVATAIADTASSWNKREFNPMLSGSNGRFGARGIAIKSLITGAAVGGQWLLVRHNPQASRPAAIANFGMSGIFAAAAAHNLGNRPAPATLK